MPRNQGTSRKGKPKKKEREAGMGRALEKASQKRFRPKINGSSRGAGMAMAPGTESIGLVPTTETHNMKSVLEMDNLTDFLGQAELANREFQSEREQFVVLDATGSQYRPNETRVSWADEKQTTKKDFVFAELSVPRRPAWDDETTPEQLDAMEKESFLEWRRSIAQREEIIMGQQQENGSHARVTPFEKNLEVWRQLWRVLERSSCVLQIVDARNPLFYLSSDLRKYAVEELGKPMLLLVNKSDYLSEKQRQEWHEYLSSQGWDHVFFSAYTEQEKLDAAAAAKRKRLEALGESYEDGELAEKAENESTDEELAEEKTENELTDEFSRDNVGVKAPLTRKELLDWLHAFAVQYKCEPDPRYGNRIQFGTLGFPNVGKSSIINVLVGSSKHSHGVVRVGVASQPGKTKHFQTLLLPDRDELMLCDCPGLVFPSFVSNTADLIAAGVYPIAQMRDYWPVVELICRRIPREILNAVYGIQLPVPTAQERKERGLDPSKIPPPTAEELLDTYCIARSMLAASSGVPDHQKASRIVIKDYADGKLLYCHEPPNVSEGQGSLDRKDFHRETILTALSKTEKLRKKLATMLDSSTIVAGDNFDQEGVDSEALLEDDLDILDAIGGLDDTEGDKSNGGKRGKNHKSMKHHGKKGRKDRNKDPYGCHSNPDEMLGSSIGGSSAGLVINAGKYGRKGYTRPLSYAGARAAPTPSTDSKMTTR